VIVFRKQGAAVVGNVTYVNGQQGNVVLVGPREHPKGATLVLPAQGESAIRTMPFAEGLALLRPETVVDILCIQERVFGQAGFSSPFGSQANG